MSRGLPVPVRPERPEVIIVTAPSVARAARRTNSLARLAVSLAPDLLDVLDKTLSQRRATAEPRLTNARVVRDSRSHMRAVQHAEVEIHTWDPFPRRVRMRTTTEWATSAPSFPESVDSAGLDDRPSRLRRTGIGVLGVGGALAIAMVGVLANRGGLLRRR